MHTLNNEIKIKRFFSASDADAEEYCFINAEIKVSYELFLIFCEQIYFKKLSSNHCLYRKQIFSNLFYVDVTKKSN